MPAKCVHIVGTTASWPLNTKPWPINSTPCHASQPIKKQGRKPHVFMLNTMSDQRVQNKSGVKSIRKYNLTVQISTEFHSFYFRNSGATLRSINISSNICTHMRILLKSKIRFTENWSAAAWPLRRLLSPSNILPPSRLITLSLPQTELAVRASNMSFHNFKFLKFPNLKLRLFAECLCLWQKYNVWVQVMEGRSWKTAWSRQPFEEPLKRMLNLCRLWYLITQNKVPGLRTLVF